jgi:uncharacterized membrane protein YeiH
MRTLSGSLGSAPLEAVVDVLPPLLLALDLVGVAVFALSGAVAAIRARLDVFGVLVLAFATALAGGVVRDVLIGAIPPLALTDWRYGTLALAAGVLAMVGHRVVERVHRPVAVLDAVGLGVFAVVGAQKALAFDLAEPIAVLLGVVTAIGGGTLRDVLLARVPPVLQMEIYAVAAAVGAAVAVAAQSAGAHAAIAAAAGALTCATLRLVSLRRGWHLPQPGSS